MDTQEAIRRRIDDLTQRIKVSNKELLDALASGRRKPTDPIDDGQIEQLKDFIREILEFIEDVHPLSKPK